jgi:serine/threonine-protein kinase
MPAAAVVEDLDVVDEARLRCFTVSISEVAGLPNEAQRDATEGFALAVFTASDYCPWDHGLQDADAMNPIAQTVPFGVARPAPAEELARGTVVDQFVINEKIGEGGMAAVYTATHPVLGKRAAVKVLALEHCSNQQAVSHFLQEARTLSLVRHPNLVDVFGYGRLRDGRSYFLMDLLEGETLLEAMARGPLSLERIYDLMMQVCDALEAAHNHHIAHLDLKPENIFLVPLPRGRTCVKLFDFGIARLIGTPQHAPEQRMFTGTPTYASPEQCMDSAEIDTRSDLYSLGIVVYQLVTGDVPFRAAMQSDVLHAHVNELPVPPRRLRPDLPEAIERLILCLLYKDPTRRPSLDEIRHVLAHPTLSETVPEVVLPRRPWRKLAVLTAVAAACAFLASRAIN